MSVKYKRNSFSFHGILTHTLGYYLGDGFIYGCIDEICVRLISAQGDATNPYLLILYSYMKIQNN